LKLGFIELPVRKFRDLKIRKKLIWMYIIVVLAPILIVGVTFSNGMKNDAIGQAVREACTNTDRIQLRLDELTGRVTDISDRICLSPKIVAILSADHGSGALHGPSIFSEITEFIRDYQEIQHIMIYTENSTLQVDPEFITAMPEIWKKDWYQKAEWRNGSVVWQYIMNEQTGRGSLCLTRLIRDDAYKPVGVLVIEISDDFLQSILEKEPYRTMIATDNSLVVSSNHTEFIGRKTWNIGIPFVTEPVNNQVLDVYEGADSSKLVLNSFIPGKSSSAFNIYTIVPVRTATERAEETITICLVILALCSAASLAIFVLFSRYLTGRIIKLKSEMRKVVEGNFDVSDEISGMDETGELHREMLKMVKSFEQLIHEVYEERLLKEQLRNKQREIQFKMLANQINPHFLYNVLETIRMRAHSKGDEETAAAVKMLARLMRRNLEASSKTVTLESELEITKNYLDLQKFRFEDKIDYEIEIAAEGYEDYRMLPMLVQPLAENAFVHGLECKRTRGRIMIRVEEQDEYLVISVRDNGIGMDGAKLERIRNMLGENAEDIISTHIGLQNVNSRIKLYYGDAYGLDISSAEKEGTMVRIRLPRKEDDYA